VSEKSIDTIDDNLLITQYISHRAFSYPQGKQILDTVSGFQYHGKKFRLWM